MNKIFLLTILISVVLACEPPTNYEERIFNNTNQVIEVQLFVLDSANMPLPYDTVLINPNHFVGLYNHSDMSTSLSTYEDCENRFIQKMIITTNNYLDTININPNENFNWEWKVLNKHFPNGGSCQCELVIHEYHI